jgi:putative ABC transport system substrate-binding protein
VDRRIRVGVPRLILVLSCLAAPLAAEAQQANRVWRVGYLLPGNASLKGEEVFVRSLRDFGYIEGQNLRIEERNAEGQYDRLPNLATELVGLQVDVIIAPGTAATRAAKRATATIPIVMAAVDEPVLQGFVESLARPGGNITGLTVVVTPELWSKRLQLLREVAPGVSRVAYLWNPRSFHEKASNLKAIHDAAVKLKVTVRSVEVREPDDFPATFSTMTREHIGGILFHATTDLYAHRGQIAELAITHRIPGISNFEEVATAGALPNLFAQLRRAAVFVDKILKGAKPADLPIEQPSKFDLVVNLKTAKALGLTIPPSLLSRADQVIE